MLNPLDPSDANLQNVENEFTPNIGAGVYFHGEKFYAGLSVPNFIETTRYNDNDRSINKERLNYYLITGYVFDLGTSLKFKPAMLTKMTMGAPLQIDVSGNFLINERFVLGAAYRWSAAVSAMVGFQITEGLFVGYGYDLETTNLNNYNTGSHEIFLRYELFNRYDRITTPRFF
jgi:type IX secretion system PorP/SprF family membrane protein